MDALHISNNQFRVEGDHSSAFHTGRRVKLDCGADGTFYATIVSSVYTSPYTFVTVDESVLTDNLITAFYSVVIAGVDGNIPEHFHTSAEGDGGELPTASFLELTDTPSTYSGTTGLYAKSTGSGIVWDEASAVSSFLDLTDTPTTYSGLGSTTSEFNLTIASSDVSEELNNFPVMVKLGSVSGKSDFDSSKIFNDLGDSFRKIKVLGPDDLPLYVEVEQWEATKKRAALHIKVPLVSASTDTILRLQWDATWDDDTTYIGVAGDVVSSNVWDEDFVCVYNMAQDPSGGADSILDSTQYDRNMTPVGTMTSDDLVDGEKYGKALRLDGTDDGMSYTPANVYSNFTAEVYLNPNGTQRVYSETTTGVGANSYPTENRIVLGEDFGSTSGHCGAGLMVGDNAVVVVLHAASFYPTPIVRTGSYSSDGYYALQVESNNISLYINSDKVGSHNPGRNVDMSIRVGHGSYGNYGGDMYTTRFSKIARTEAWLNATSKTLSDEFITLSESIEQAPGEFMLKLNDSKDGLAWVEKHPYPNALSHGETPPTQATLRVGDYYINETSDSVLYKEGTGQQTLIYSVGNFLIHSDATDGTNTFVDSSDTPTTISPGAIIHSSEQAKFGQSSMKFGTNTNPLVVTNDGRFNFPTNTDFTIDYWLYKAEFTTNAYHMDIGSNGSIIRTGYTPTFDVMNVGSADTIIQHNVLPPTNQWTHIALTRKGDQWYLFYDGILQTNVTSSSAFGNTSNMSIGNYGGTGSYALNGYIDEFHVVRGEARWTENFTPPGTAYPYYSSANVWKTVLETPKKLIDLDMEQTTYSGTDGQVVYSTGSGIELAPVAQFRSGELKPNTTTAGNLGDHYISTDYSELFKKNRPFTPGAGFTAKTVIIDIANNWGDTGYIEMYELHFFDSENQRVEVLESDLQGTYATTAHSNTRLPNVFRSDVDDGYWASVNANITNQRLIVNFVTAKTFFGLTIKNSDIQARRSKDIKIYISDADITDATYNSFPSAVEKIYDAQLPELEQLVVLDLAESTEPDSGWDSILTILKFINGTTVPDLNVQSKLNDHYIDTTDESIYVKNRITTVSYNMYTAKTVIFDIDTVYGSTDSMGIRMIEFLDHLGQPIPRSPSTDYTAYAKYYYSTYTHPNEAFNTSRSKTGTSADVRYYTGVGWLSCCGGATAAPNRLIVVFNEPLSFYGIRVNNYHQSGGALTRGAKDVIVYMSENTITDTDHGDALSGTEEIFNGTFAQHVAEDIADDQVLELTPSPSAIVDAGWDKLLDVRKDILELDNTPESYLGVLDKYLKFNGTSWVFDAPEATLSVFSGESEPSNSVGLKDNFYLRLSTGQWYKKDYLNLGTDIIAGGTHTVSSEQVGSGYQAFNNVDGDRWTAASTTAWAKYDFGAGNEKSANGTSFIYGVSTSVLRVKLEASNDDVSWTTLLPETDSFACVDGQRYSYTFETSALYRYYRWTFISNGTVGVREIELFGASVYEWRLLHTSRFVDLEETPNTFEDGKYAKSTTSGIIWADPEVPPIAFKDLTDTPATYSGTIGKLLYSDGTAPTWIGNHALYGPNQNDFSPGPELYYFNTLTNTLYHTTATFAFDSEGATIDRTGWTFVWNSPSSGSNTANVYDGSTSSYSGGSGGSGGSGYITHHSATMDVAKYFHTLYFRWYNNTASSYTLTISVKKLETDDWTVVYSATRGSSGSAQNLYVTIHDKFQHEVGYVDIKMDGPSTMNVVYIYELSATEALGNTTYHWTAGPTFIDGSAASFTGLIDTPEDYTGSEDLYLKSTGSGIVFNAPPNQKWQFGDSGPGLATSGEIDDLYYDKSTGDVYKKYVPAGSENDINDTFDGTTLDSATWGTLITPSASVTVDGVLQLNNINGGAHSGAAVFTKFTYNTLSTTAFSCLWRPHGNHYSSADVPYIAFRHPTAHTPSSYYGIPTTNFVLVRLGDGSDTSTRTSLRIHEATGQSSNTPINIDSSAWHELVVSVNWETREISVDIDSGTYTLTHIFSEGTLAGIGDTFVFEMGTCDYNKTNTEQFDNVALVGDPIIPWGKQANFGGTTTFLDLSDTPATYSGTEGYFATSTGSGIALMPSSSARTIFTETTAPTPAGGAVGDLYIESPKNTIYEKMFIPAGNIAKYWRLQIIDNLNDSYVEIAKFELRATEGGADQAPAAGGTASASSFWQAGYEADKAFDGNTATFWICSDNQADGSWLQYEFPSNTEVREIKLVPRVSYGGYMPTHFKLQLSSNGSEWQDVKEWTDITGWTNDGKVFAVPTPDEANGWDTVLDAPETFTDLMDTPTTYSGTDGMYLESTGSGVAWTTLAGRIVHKGVPDQFTEGVIGDFAIDESSSAFYEKKRESELSGKLARSVVLDITNSYGSSTGIRSVEFINDGQLIAISDANADAYASAFGGAARAPIFAFDTTTSKTGSADNNSWHSNNAYNNRLIVVFNSNVTFDQIVINNYHDAGLVSNYGAKDVKIYITQDVYSDTTFEATVTNSTLIFDGVFTQHPATDTVDDQVLTLLDTQIDTGWDVVLDVPQAFLDLPDTPESYLSTLGQYLVSNGTGLEFTALDMPYTYDGEGVPSNDLGAKDDYYLDTLVDVLYKKDEVSLSTDLFQPGGTVTISSAQSGYPQSNAIDNNNSTHWLSAQTNAWWKYDFGSGNEQLVSAFSASMTQTIDYTFTLHGSNNDTDWVLLHSTGTTAMTDGVPKVFPFDEVGPYRYFRFTIVNVESGSSAFIAVREFELFGSSQYVWRVLRPNKSFVKLEDTPDAYENVGDYLITTATGLEFVAPLPKLLDGVGEPSTVSGITNDYYYNASTDVIYKKDNYILDSTDLFQSDGTITASSAQSSYYASNAVDDNNSTYWLSSNVSNAWWKYDFGEGNTNVVGGFSASMTQSVNYTFDLHGSNNNSTWDLLYSSGSVAFTANQYKDFSFNNLQAYRYYRFTISNKSSSAFVAVNEFKLYSGGYAWRALTNSSNRMFTGLLDTPSEYTGYVDKFLKTTPSGIVFSDLPETKEFYTGESTPASNLGKIGDFYISTSGNKLYERTLGDTASDSFQDHDVVSLTLVNESRTLRAIDGADWGSARSATTRNSGKYYVESTASATVYQGLGITGTGDDLLFYLGSKSDSWGWLSQVGAVRRGGGDVASAFSATAGDTVGMAVDLDNNRLYFSKNGSWLVGDPSTGTGGVDISARLGAMHLGATVGGYNGPVDFAVNFGQSSFIYTTPTGYTSGWPSDGEFDPWETVMDASTPSFIDLTDTPTTYSGGGQYLRTTTSGIEAIDGIILKAPNDSEWVIQVTNSGTLYTVPK